MMKTNTTNRGFTLIELLVVIAIIGILASVVLASLNTARDRGRAASAQSSMSQARTQAELGIDNAGTYIIDLCNTSGATPGGIQTLTAAATTQGGTALSCGQNTAVGVRPSAWGAAITLPGGAGNFCVDSTGFAGTVAAAPGTEIANGASSADVVCGNG